MTGLLEAGAEGVGIDEEIVELEDEVTGLLEAGADEETVL